MEKQKITTIEGIQAIKEYTRRSNYAEAITLAASLLRKIKSAELVSEIIRLMIITKDYDSAFKSLQSYIKLFGKNNSIDEELLLRFNIDTEFKYAIQSDIRIKPSRYEWVNNYYNTLSDYQYFPEIYGCEVQCSGVAVYTFKLMCPCCGEKYNGIVIGTLLVKKTVSCPCCLGRQVLTYEMIRTYVETMHGDMTSESALQMDKKVSEVARKIFLASNNDDMPEFVKIFGQDAVFALIQIVTEELLNE